MRPIIGVTVPVGGVIDASEISVIEHGIVGEMFPVSTSIYAASKPPTSRLDTCSDTVSRSLRSGFIALLP